MGEKGERPVWPQRLLLLLMLGAACAGTTRLSSQPWKHDATKRTKQQRFPFPAFSFPALVLSHPRVGTSCCHLASVPIPIPIPIRARRQWKINFSLNARKHCALDVCFCISFPHSQSMPWMDISFSHTPPSSFISLPFGFSFPFSVFVPPKWVQLHYKVTSIERSAVIPNNTTWTVIVTWTRTRTVVTVCVSVFVWVRHSQ